MRLGEILIDKGILTSQQLEEVLQLQAERKIRLGEVVVKKGWISSQTLAQTLAAHFHLPYIDLREFSPAAHLVKSFPKALAVEYQVLPIKEEGEKLMIALSDPTDLTAQDTIQFYLHRPVSFAVADPTKIQTLLSKYFSNEEEVSAGISSPETTPFFNENETIIHLVHELLTQAVTSGVSDIHLEPLRHALRVRYRLDGVCYDRDYIPPSYQGAVISRVKLLSGMDITEHRLPQDGRIQMNVFQKVVDFRVSSVPAKYGESLVLRILDKEGLAPGIKDLGFLEEDCRAFIDLIKAPDGILLVTGPTGSGKTTTLYAALKETQSREIKIITTEDPVEYTLDGISQIQVHSKVGLDFGRALRHILRHDPDVILVGEIRDFETAEIAMRSAMTGHKVYSTLHTNDAPSAINRLINIGVEPFLIGASLRTIIAQRLVRKLCSACKIPSLLKDHDLKLLGVQEEREIFQPRGCLRCGQTGYRGRVALFEMMPFTESIKALTLERRPSAEIRKAALASGMRSLREDGLNKVLLGITSIAEVLSVTEN
ncbi:MAG: ATPase, T2SS/T4P/T4SS family (plasmid) [Candidatus Manganitrophus sp.]|nr:ATPase, T2SS/T4P/T4SS family [Candidatus Manganitrophus sp.]MDC4228356.1 ATPase, T2SS/T4P/T4SS family [Candidatus Manganitrophus sp.]WDT73693.1 MAG: ATPase, T2SS/T4P/T4SS family [Candidatus Manganitrophus sp.]WDT77995.1 MAG: ATPase, T2SS/T4P/T4SS family [Candidatus Manganitrophus sp.]WDT82919.1 MAG: ATPase, T2SS/T4P/T4SS family [Candidatus Manganitrophus sp.]